MILTCACCGFTREFADAEEAFREGWDAPPRFTGPVTCDLCPSTYLLFGVDHSDAHDKWKREGRPVL